MELFLVIRDMVADLMDAAPATITPDSYLVRDLGFESIDFMELSVSLSAAFSMAISDETLFLTRLREQVEKARADGGAVLDRLKAQYGYLPEQRLEAIVADLDNGPVIQIADLTHYLRWTMARKKVGG